MDKETNKRVSNLEEDIIFEEFESADWQYHDTKEEVNFRDWNQNYEGIEDYENIEQIIAEEIEKYKKAN